MGLRLEKEFGGLYSRIDAEGWESSAEELVLGPRLVTVDVELPIG